MTSGVRGTRYINRAYRIGSRHPGRTGVDELALPPLPAHAAFGPATKKSGIGRETSKMMLDHYQQTKNVLVSYSPKAMGFF